LSGTTDETRIPWHDRLASLARWLPGHKFVRGQHMHKIYTLGL